VWSSLLKTAGVDSTPGEGISNHAAIGARSLQLLVLVEGMSWSAGRHWGASSNVVCKGFV
jgi:hypothetical protein